MVPLLFLCAHSLSILFAPSAFLFLRSLGWVGVGFGLLFWVCGVVGVVFAFGWFGCVVGWSSVVGVGFCVCVILLRSVSLCLCCAVACTCASIFFISFGFLPVANINAGAAMLYAVGGSCAVGDSCHGLCMVWLYSLRVGCCIPVMRWIARSRSLCA